MGCRPGCWLPGSYALRQRCRPCIGLTGHWGGSLLSICARASLGSVLFPCSTHHPPLDCPSRHTDPNISTMPLQIQLTCMPCMTARPIVMSRDTSRKPCSCRCSCSRQLLECELPAVSLTTLMKHSHVAAGLGQALGSSAALHVPCQVDIGQTANVSRAIAVCLRCSGQHM